MSYEIPTPSALRGLVESIYWKPEADLRVRSVRVLAPLRWEGEMRNEIKAVPSLVSPAPVDVEKVRTQRHALVLRDVEYVVEVEVGSKGGDSADAKKHHAVLTRRLERGEFFTAPYLGLSEYEAEVQPITREQADRLPVPDEWRGERDLGRVFWGFSGLSDRYGYTAQPTSHYFHAVARDGVVIVPEKPDDAPGASGGLLGSLYAFAVRHSLGEAPEMEAAPVDFALHIGADGTLLQKTDLRQPKPNGDPGRGPEKLIPRRDGYLHEPRPLVSDLKYLTDQRTRFLCLVEEAAEADRSLVPVVAFLRSDGAAQEIGNYAFVIESPENVEGTFAHESPVFRQWWRERWQATQRTEVGVCAITGERGALARLGIMAGKASFSTTDKPSFVRYGLRTGGGVRVTLGARSRIDAATRHLRRRESRNVVPLGDDALVFWTADDHRPAEEAMRAVLSGKEAREIEEARVALLSPWEGRPAAISDTSEWHAMLARFPQNGRISVRSYYRTTVADVARRIETWMRLSGGMPLLQLLASITPPGKGGRSKVAQASRDLTRAAYSGDPLTVRVRDAVLERHEVGVLQKPAAGKRERGIQETNHAARIALLRLVAGQGGLEMSGRGHALGRLLGIAERMQTAASERRVGVTVSQRRYVALTHQPSTVWDLRKEMLEWASRLHRRGKGGLAVALEREALESFTALGGDFTALRPEERGAFAVGHAEGTAWPKKPKDHDAPEAA